MNSEIKKLRSYWQEEVDAAYLYNILSENTVKESERSSFLKLSDIETRHAEAWEKLLNDKGIFLPKSAPTFKARLIALITEYSGPGLLMKWLKKEESSGVKSYLDLYKISSDADTKNLTLKLAREEAQHAELLGGITQQSTEPWHKTESGGMLRNVVYGFNDGLTANFGLIAGIFGASAQPHIILLSGLAGAVADALSMGSSGYLAAKSEKEVYERERKMEADEILLMPELETEELAAIYESKGMDANHAMDLAKEVMADPARALEEKVKEELGISTSEISPLKEAWITGLATALGAIIPVVPFFFLEGMSAAWFSFSLSMAAHFAVGAARSFFTGKGLWRSGWEMLIVGFGIAGVGYFLGELLMKFL